MMILQQQRSIGAEPRAPAGVSFAAEVPQYPAAPDTPPTPSASPDAYSSSEEYRRDRFLRTIRSRSADEMNPEAGSDVPERDARSADPRVSIKTPEPSEPEEAETPLDLSVSSAKEEKFFRHPREISVRDFAKEPISYSRDEPAAELLARYSREVFRSPQNRDLFARDPRDFVARDPREFMSVPGEFRDPREFVRHAGDSGTESDDSGGRLSPSDDLQKAGKAYKKSLMKRYCKS